MNLYLLTVGYRRISADAQNRTALLNLCMECEFSYTDFACEDAPKVLRFHRKNPSQGLPQH